MNYLKESFTFYNDLLIKVEDYLQDLESLDISYKYNENELKHFDFDNNYWQYYNNIGSNLDLIINILKSKIYIIEEELKKHE